MEKNIDPYEELGVSSKKEGVHEAIKNLSKGLYSGAFCKINKMPDNLPQEIIDKYVQIIHSDGVGTKSNVAYLAKMEGLGNSFLRTIPQDALVMNIDDMACVGVTNNIYISNHIARNANRISNEDISEIIKGYSDFYDFMKNLGINIYGAGGETADVGSYTTTLGVDVTASSIIERKKVIDCSNIKPNEYIVGFASYGKSNYETKENSGIRSNGLTLAINSLLNPYYRKYKEVMDSTIDEKKLFNGKYYLTDKLKETSLSIAEAILSPTRTYLPIIKKILEEELNISGIIHCSGGGLTKSLNYGNGIKYVKENINYLKTPRIFEEIQEIRGFKDINMYQTFNMGIGMEIIARTIHDAFKIKKIANSFGIDSAIIGVTSKSENEYNEVNIINNGNKLVYKKKIV